MEHYWRNRLLRLAPWAIAWAIVLIVGFIGGRELSAALGADRGSFDAGMLATILGIVVGAPIAIGISLELARQERASQDEDRSQRVDALLGDIERDLSETLAELTGEDRRDRDRVIAPFLGSGLWTAIQASGGAALIPGPTMLREVSRAYDRIAVTAYLERQVWELYHNPQDAMRVMPPRPPMHLAVMESIVKLDDSTMAAINVALQEIRSRPGRPPGLPIGVTDT
jgi:hypothetical protein